LYGSYNIPNIAFAIELGKYFGANLKQIKKAICSYISSNNRSQVKVVGTNEVIMDAYNANPSSMKASLDSFSKHRSNRKLAILGDMLELGEFARAEHEAVINYARSLNLQKLVFIGKMFKSLQDGENFFSDIAEAKPYIDSLELDNYTILLKGSRGIAVDKLFE
jgi:UDP-N-acetylmuramoyl-tripeptide--D-alanyl-D-alanine ligase